jgi:hypothetical protein
VDLSNKEGKISQTYFVRCLILIRQNNSLSLWASTMRKNEIVGVDFLTTQN